MADTLSPAQPAYTGSVNSLAAAAAQDVPRCFSLPDGFVAAPQSWSLEWHAVFAHRPLDLPHVQQRALASILPILLCGEQSAIAAFHYSVLQLQARAQLASIHLFRSIALDESQHDLCLSLIQQKLPSPENLPAIRRQAQLFFTRLGRCTSSAAHFARIASLDSGVAIIMKALEHGSIGMDRSLKILFERIKKDEARHVYTSRSHAFRLGLSPAEYAASKIQVRSQLVELLRPYSLQFDQLGVDPDVLFRQLGRTGDP